MVEVFSIQIREALCVRFACIPLDLTQAEAGKIGAVIMALATPDADTPDPVPSPCGADVAIEPFQVPDHGWSSDILLFHLDQSPDDPTNIVADLLTETVAVVVVDLEDFSEDMEHDGVVSALMGVAGFRKGVADIAPELGGRLVKFWADNAMLCFPTVSLALDAATAIHECFDCGIGIGYGPVVVLTDDLWGVEVNEASKLGEDFSEVGETHLTPGAFAEFDNLNSPFH